MSHEISAVIVWVWDIFLLIFFQFRYHHSKRAQTTRGQKIVCGLDHDRSIVLGKRVAMHHLTKEMAHYYLVNYHKLLPIGLRELISELRIKKKHNAKAMKCCFFQKYFAAICDAHSDLKKPVEEGDSEKDEPQDENMDPEWTLEDAGKEPIDVSPDVLSSFNEFAKKAGVRGACPATDFRSFARDTKLRRVSALKKLNAIMISIMAPDSENELKELFISSFAPRSWKDSSETKLKSVLDEIADQYDHTTDRRSKEIILSVIADILPYREIQQFIPGVSIRRYYNAKRRAIRKEDIKPVKIHRTRYEPVRVNYFTTFLTRYIIKIREIIFIFHLVIFIDNHQLLLKCVRFYGPSIRRENCENVGREEGENPEHVETLSKCRDMENVFQVYVG